MTPRPIRVGLNLVWLVPGSVGGSEEYTVRLLEAWAAAPPADIDLRLLVNTALVASPHRALTEAFPTVVAPVSGHARAGRVVTDTTWIRGQVAEHHLDLLHHMGGTVPLGLGGPCLLTIHDLQPLSMPENFSVAKRRYLGFMVPRSVRRATRIATLTAWVAADVEARLGVPSERFVRVPPGVRSFAAPTATELADVLGRYDLRAADPGAADGSGPPPRPFFLYPAITYRHKNHVLLVHAFAEVHRRHPDAVLVLTGGAAEEEDRVTAAIARLDLGGFVRRTGRIPARDLEVLYQAATALTCASRYEGTGIPVLEAMVAGCPVIAADGTGLVETVGEAGLLVGPSDVDGWATAMDRVLTDPDRRADLAAAGRLAARRYDWAASADALAAAYRAVASAS